MPTIEINEEEQQLIAEAYYEHYCSEPDSVVRNPDDYEDRKEYRDAVIALANKLGVL